MLPQAIRNYLPRKKKMDCFARPNRAKKLTDAQKARIVTLRFDLHRSIESIAADCETSVSVFYYNCFLHEILATSNVTQYLTGANSSQMG